MSYYAADAGIQDAVWQIKYDHILNFTTPSAYSPYDFSTVWTDQVLSNVNGQNVTATIQNNWVVSILLRKVILHQYYQWSTVSCKRIYRPDSIN